MVDEDWRILIPGRDIARWPQMRIARAVEGLSSLRAQIATWIASGGAFAVPRLDADRMRIKLVLKVRAMPPVDAWAMLLGESIHHLRASLDGLAWDVAHLDGGQPDDPTKVYFPIFSDRSRWNRAIVGSLATVPPQILQRLKELQPFRQPTGTKSFLATLHALDIADKHNGLLLGKATFSLARIEGMQFQAEHFAPEDLANIGIEYDGKPAEIIDGVEVGAFHLPKPLNVDSIDEVPIPIEVQFWVQHGDLPISLEEILSRFPELTTEVLRRVHGTGEYLGTEPDRD